MIFVKAYADLAEYLNVQTVGQAVEYNNSGTSCQIINIADFFTIPHGKISIILVNGEYGEMDSVVKDGDQVVFFSPVDGG